LPVLLDAGGNHLAYLEILSDLKALGAEFSGLSGAGSTCFGVFTDEGAANRAAGALAKRWNFVECTFFLACSAKAVLQWE
jgi:4-diphosphocytidyl-2C-methyl-D-erythritol kinase